ncbi:uncharacterized protein LTR77_008251 [Saxophila tyrrhenica]|uniref:Initiation-specific alpha-1,6-mannosyltransferase n=1 Tax=Saxophila tyrrhenica TaxID=1690608 RepID=A0AAV9P297_9PEZI|nr:hypothetical protein LTR77_008251 [Saxophila tyrrhenica]
MQTFNSRPPFKALFANQFRMLLILFATCTVFLLLHSTLGGFRDPSFLPMEQFPKKIWQSWKVDALRFEDRDTERAMSWTTKNAAHRYEVLTDDSAMTYVEQFYGPFGLNRPDIVYTYRSLNSIRIIQSDLLRYLIMYAEGGVWADIDVEAVRSIEHFIPKRFNEKDVNMVIGIETDEPGFKDHPLLGSKAQSFCQWTFMCKPRLPVMMRLINNILLWLNNLSQSQGVPISELQLDFDEVLSGTGPSAFTTAILAEMSVTEGEQISWDPFHDLEESRVVGEVLVLPSEAFAAGTGHSDSGNHGGRGALVMHHFHASSWPTQHPRYKHPVYGEVEKCNWDPECVALWDTNTAFFESLPEEDQLKMIAIKDQDDLKAQKKEAEVDHRLALHPGLA